MPGSSWSDGRACSSPRSSGTCRSTSPGPTPSSASSTWSSPSSLQPGRCHPGWFPGSSGGAGSTQPRRCSSPAGMALEVAAPTWPVFVAGAGLTGAGCGAMVSVGSSIVMDLAASGSGGRLSLLHLFYSVGALVAPIVIGVLVSVGVEWRLIAAATGLTGVALAGPLSRAGSVPPRPRPAVPVATAIPKRPAERPSARPRGARPRGRLLRGRRVRRIELAGRLPGRRAVDGGDPRAQPLLGRHRRWSRGREPDRRPIRPGPLHQPRARLPVALRSSPRSPSPRDRSGLASSSPPASHSVRSTR